MRVVGKRTWIRLQNGGSEPRTSSLGERRVFGRDGKRDAEPFFLDAVRSSIFCASQPPLGSIGKNNLGDFCLFLNCLLHFCCFLGVYIIPEWLIKVPGHIAILFG